MRNKLKLPPPCEKTREDFAELLAQCPNKIQFVFDSEKEKQILERIKQLKQSTVKEAT